MGDGGEGLDRDVGHDYWTLVRHTEIYIAFNLEGAEEVSETCLKYAMPPPQCQCAE